MPGFLSNLLRMLRERRGTDMRFLCRHLLSERGEASQTALAQEIINTYKAMNSTQRLAFFEMLSREFSPDEAAVNRAAADYRRKPGAKTLAALSAAVEAPRQELFRRINTAQRGTEALGNVWGFLDATPYGRQESWEKSPDGWPQAAPYQWWRRHDEYDK